MDALPAGFTLDQTQPPAPISQGIPGSALPPGYQLDDDKYDTLGNTALATAEGAARAATLGGSDVLETQTGLRSPEEIKATREHHPIASGVGGFLGAGALIGATGGFGAPLEGAAFGFGNVISDAALGDPDLNAQKIIANVGGGALFGAGLGMIGKGLAGIPAIVRNAQPAEGVAGAMESLPIAARDPISEGFNQDIINNTPSTPPGSNGAEIKSIAQRNEWPVLEGMLTDDKHVNMAEDALINSPETWAGGARGKQYQAAFDSASKSVDNAIASDSSLSETQVGNQLKESLLDKLNERYQPIKDLYDAIEPYRPAIPVSDRSTGALGRTIEGIIEDQGLVPGSERYNFVKTFSDGIDNVDNLQKLANFRTEVSRSSGPLTKDLAGIISDKLNGVEERAIGRFASTMKSPAAKEKIMNLIDQAQDAKSSYSGFRDTLQELGNSIGKKKIYGPQNFMDFLDNLNPQTLTRRLFNENNTEFAQYFAKEFPDEMNIMRGYQRAQIRAGAVKNEAFNPNTAIKDVFSMEPETRDILFNPKELKTLKDANTYLNSFPDAFNPSGTSHMSSFRSFYDHPAGALLANARDAAIHAFVTHSERLPQINSLKSTLSGFDSKVNSTIKNVLSGGAISAATGIAGAQLSPDQYKKVTERINQLSRDPSSLSDHIEGVINPMANVAPNISQSLAKSMAGSIQFLSSKVPQPADTLPLSRKYEPTEAQKRTFSEYYNAVDNPISALGQVKNGTLTGQTMEALQAVHPQLLQEMRQKMTAQFKPDQVRDLPNGTKLAISKFMGQPLDENMIPQVMAATQAAFQSPSLSQQGIPKQRGRGGLGAMKNLKKSGRIATRTTQEQEEGE